MSYSASVAGLYKQIPIHIEENSSKRAEGLFLSPEALAEAATFEAACKTRFRSFWLQSSAKAKTPINACLVFNPQEAYYLDEKCEGTTGPIPAGGWLYAMDGKTLISEEGAHYLEP